MRIIILLFATFGLFGQTKLYLRTSPSEIEIYFEQAYEKFPDLPRHILEAMAYQRTHIYNINSTKKEEQLSQTNCMGQPIGYGIFGLFEGAIISDSKGKGEYFSDNLNTVCKHYGVNKEEFKKSIKVQIFAVASYLSYLKTERQISANTLENFAEVLIIFNHSEADNHDIYFYLLNGFETTEVKVSADPTLKKYFDDNYKTK
jgi:hypothetical protein